MKVLQPTGTHAGKSSEEDFHHRYTKLKNWFAPDTQANVFSFAYPGLDIVANFLFAPWHSKPTFYSLPDDTKICQKKAGVKFYKHLISTIITLVLSTFVQNR